MPRHGLLFVSCMLACVTASAVSLGSFDDFQSGNTTWQNGFALGIVSRGGGPAGSEDYFLQVPSYAAGGESSRMIIFNQGEWSGDYASAGIGKIEVDLANFGTTELSIRLAFTETAVRVGYVSLDPVPLPADAVWRHFVFPIDASTFVPIGTTKTLVQALSNVAQFRILSQAGDAPTSTRGDPIEGSLGIDNVRAAVPEPSVAWLLVCGAALAARVRRPRNTAHRRRERGF